MHMLTLPHQPGTTVCEARETPFMGSEAHDQQHGTSLGEV